MKVWPLGPPSSWSWVDSSASPSGVTRSWTLGLRNSSPAIALRRHRRSTRASPGTGRASATRPRSGARGGERRSPRLHPPRRVPADRAGRRGRCLSETPSFSFISAARRSGRSARWRHRQDCVCGGRSPPADRVRDAFLGEEPAAVFVPKWKCLGSRRTSGSRAPARGRVRARSCCTGRDGQLCIEDQVADALTSRGRSRIFWLSGREEPSRSRRGRAACVCGGSRRAAGRGSSRSRSAGSAARSRRRAGPTAGRQEQQERNRSRRPGGS